MGSKKKRKTPSTPDQPPQGLDPQAAQFRTNVRLALAGLAITAVGVGVTAVQCSKDQPNPEIRLTSVLPPQQVSPALLRFVPPNRPGQTVTHYSHLTDKRGRPSGITWEQIYFTETFDVAMIVRTPAVGERETTTYFERWRHNNAGTEDHSLEGALVRRRPPEAIVEPVVAITPAARAWLEQTSTRLFVGDVLDPGVPVKKGFTWTLARPVLEQLASIALTPEHDSPRRAELDTANTTSEFVILSLEHGVATFAGRVMLVLKSVTVDGERVATGDLPLEMTLHGEVSTSAGDWTGYEVTVGASVTYPFQFHGRRVSAYTFDVRATIGARPGGVIPAVK